MKTSRLIGTFLIIILAIHAIGIGIFYYKGKKSEALPSDPGVTTPTPAEVEPPAPEPEVKKPANPLFGTRFVYTNAIQGDLPAVLETNEVRAGILVNLDSRQVLWAKEPREGYPIASMTKMMTLLLAAEAMERNPEGLNKDTPVKVTLASSKIGGSQVWLDPRETLPLGELLKAIAIKSANDAAYLVAEYLNDGDVAGFVGLMNRRARELRMPSTAFVNPYGLKTNDGKNSVSSPEGMAILAERLLEFPDIMEMCSTRLSTFRPEGKGHLQLTNTNGLLGKCTGVDGLKTGYIKESGFCITVTCLRGGKRMVAVVMGAPTTPKRNAVVQKLLDWGYKRDSELSYTLEEQNSTLPAKARTGAPLVRPVAAPGTPGGKATLPPPVMPK